MWEAVSSDIVGINFDDLHFQFMKDSGRVPKRKREIPHLADLALAAYLGPRAVAALRRVQLWFRSRVHRFANTIRRDLKIRNRATEDAHKAWIASLLEGFM
jgi:hypothetical protein